MTLTKFEIVAEIEKIIGPTTKLWAADKGTLERILMALRARR